MDSIISSQSSPPRTLAPSESKVSLSAWIRQEDNAKIPAEADQNQGKRNIDHYLLEDGEVETEDSITMFNQWCEREGVHMPKCEYPAFFGNGLRGVRCTEDIQHREAYLFVPYKMIISVAKTQKHPVLGPIVLAHPECFDEDY